MVNETTKRLMTRVKQIRQAQGLSQEEFAERADLDPKYYQHAEAGRKLNPGMDTLLKLANGCGVELWRLLKFDEEPLVANEDPGTFETAARKRAHRLAKGTRTKD